MKKRLLLIPFLFIATASCLLAQSGKVFQDMNGNGVQDAGEPGVAGITIKSFMANDNMKATAISDSLGNYSLSPGAGNGQRIRVEFSIPASMSYFKPAFKGNTYGSAVQFKTGSPSNVNFAVVNKGKFIKPASDPILIHSRFTFGNQVTGQFKDTCVLFGVRSSWGKTSASDGNYSTWHTNNPYRIATAKEVGSVFGIVYSAKRNMIYTSAYFRQFNGFGPGGPGAIYKIPYDMNTGNRTAAPSTLVDVSTLSGQSMSADPHGTDLPVNWAYNPLSSDARMAMVSKYSLGDMEISEDESKIYTINLGNREVVAINPDNGALAGRWSIPTSGLTNSLGSVNGNDVRPFGLGYKNGTLYVGAVCSGQSTQTNNGTASGARGNSNSLHAYVWSLNESTGAFTLVLDFKIKTATSGCYTWQDSWANGVRRINPSATVISQAQPILSDIDFYGNDMIIGFRNRANDQWGINIPDPANGNAYSYTEKWGDILGARFVSNTGKYILENAGTIGARTASGTAGVNSGYNEFYRGDGARSAGNDYGFENASGSFVQLANGTLASLQNFPTFSFELWPDGDQAGITYMNNENGAATKAYSSFMGDLFNCPAGKSNGLGGIESITSSAPIEIGNRVWNDANGNGLQDGDEDGIEGVIIQLYNATGTILLGTSVTDNEGDYVFDYSNVSGEVQPNTTYIIRIAPAQFNDGGLGLLAGSVLTPAGIVGSGAPGCADNDAVVVAGIAQITYTTGDYGDNNHDLDFGMKAASFLSVANITSFTATKNRETSLLQWETNAERDLAYFEVERSTDGRNWQPLGRVTARGNSSSPVNYHFSDMLPKKGVVNLYRLRQVGTDAEIHYSEIRSVRFNEDGGSISLFPNPAVNRFAINMPENFVGNTVAVKIINASGQIVLQKTLTSAARQENFDCQSFPAGAYRVLAGMNNGEKPVNIPLQVIR